MPKCLSRSTKMQWDQESISLITAVAEERDYKRFNQLNLTLKCCTWSCGLLRLDCHDFKLRQNLVDKVDNFRASIVAALAANVGVPELHVAEEDVGQHGTKPLADILKQNNTG